MSQSQKKRIEKQLPTPQCSLGYPLIQLQDILGATKYKVFNAWHSGQTGAICTGTEWDAEKGESVETGCGPHGIVVYKSDVVQFLSGGKPLD